MNVLIGAVIVGVAAALSIVAMSRVRRHAPRRTPAARRQQPRRGGLRRPRHRLLGAARLPHFPGLRELRRGPGGSGDRGVAGGAADRDGPAPPGRPEGRTRLRPRVLYPRYVIAGEWDDHAPGEKINPWGVALFRATEQMAPASATEEAAYAKWLDRPRPARRPPPRPHPRGRRPHPALFPSRAPTWFRCVLFRDRICFSVSTLSCKEALALQLRCRCSNHIINLLLK